MDKSPITNPNIPFRRNRLLQVLIVVYIALWGILAISPSDRKLWVTENILPVSVFFILVFTYKQFRFSNLSYLFMFLFLCLHLYAAHYTYQNTPFDMWLKLMFHTKRSYFDRVVHFAFGLFWTYPFSEILNKVTGRRGVWSYIIPVAVVFSLSSLFEIVEMFAAYFAGQVGVDYIGLQGDIYDTQKDMGLGFVGAVISTGIHAGIVKIIRKKRKTRTRSGAPFRLSILRRKQGAK